MSMNLKALHARLGYQTLLLAACGLLTSTFLGLVNLSTHEPIEQRLKEDVQASLQEVLPKNLYDNDLLKNVVIIPSQGEETRQDNTEVHRARKEGRVTAVAFKLIAPDGYAGPITLIMGVDRSGTIVGVRVIAHTETPGLGDKIEINKADWILSFNGRSLTNTSPLQFKVKKDGGAFDQFSGATITPRAIVKAVAGGLQFFQRHRAELIPDAGSAKAGAHPPKGEKP